MSWTDTVDKYSSNYNYRTLGNVRVRILTGGRVYVDVLKVEAGILVFDSIQCKEYNSTLQLPLWI